MIASVLLMSAGLVVGGPFPAALLGAASVGARFVRGRNRSVPIRPVLIVLLVELRSGLSALAALQRAASAHPDNRDLGAAVRVATISGMTAGIEAATGEVRALLVHVARAQRSGASLTRTIRSILEADLATERSERISRARGLPVRLMIPMALMILPGLLLMMYAPGLVRLLSDLAGPLS